MLAELLEPCPELGDRSDVPTPERRVVAGIVEQPRRELDRLLEIALVDPEHPIGLDGPPRERRLARQLRVRSSALEGGSELPGELRRLGARTLRPRSLWLRRFRLRYDLFLFPFLFLFLFLFPEGGVSADRGGDPLFPLEVSDGDNHARAVLAHRVLGASA